MPRKPFRKSFSCPRCKELSKRVFGTFFHEEMMKDDIRFSVIPEIVPYIVLDWWGCANEKCRNWFNRWPNLSCCPVCHNWSVSFVIENENKHWRCLKIKDCGWSFSITIKD